MKEECLICKAPLEYLESAAEMKCSLCQKTVLSNARCVEGHFVCDDCHSRGADAIFGICLAEKSKNPIAILQKLMAQPFCHMHGPEHHIMVAASLLTAYKNAGGNIDLEAALKKAYERGKAVPGGVCGFWGTCGAAISCGIYVSIITGSTPLAEEAWGSSNSMTSQALAEIAKIGGPRCCKRDSFLAVSKAIEFTKEHFNAELEKQKIICAYFDKNNQCLGAKCPFNPKKEDAE